MSDSTHLHPDQPAVGWRDRLFGWRAVAATTLAAVILGSAGGVALAAAADNGTERGGFPGRGQMPANGQVPGGQLPGGQLPGDGQFPAPPQGQIPAGIPGQQPATLPRTDGEEA